MGSNVPVGAGLIAALLLAASCHSPSWTIRPVIHDSDHDRYQAMKSAPVVVIAEVTSYKLISGFRQVARPPNPLVRAGSKVPLRLAQISANVLLPLRGHTGGPIEFYSWVWASGMHGGGRLFNYQPGYIHVLFLRWEGGYLHTVGDYPAHDLRVDRSWLPAMISRLQSSQDGTGPFERLVTVLLDVPAEEVNTIALGGEPLDFPVLIELTSPFFVASHLDSMCRNFGNRFGRFAACTLTAQTFYGRCKAYHLALQADTAGVEADAVFGSFARCVGGENDTIGWLRMYDWPYYSSDPSKPATAGQKRLAMRLYASAMDLRVREAACQAAASMPEARDIPECATPGESQDQTRQPR